MSYSQVRSVCILAAVITSMIIVYESIQARGEPGMISLSTNQAYVGHFAVYAALGFAAMVALGRRTFAALAVVVLASALLGVALELFQAHLPTRTASVGDALADISGAALGVLTYVVFAAFLPRPLRANR